MRSKLPSALYTLLLALPWASQAQIAQPQGTLERALRADIEGLRDQASPGYNDAIRSFKRHLVETTDPAPWRWPLTAVCQSAGKDSHQVAMVLIQFLKDRDANVRIAAVSILGCLKSELAYATPPLIRALRLDPNSGVRSSAANVLGGTKDAKILVPVLLRTLRVDKSDGVRAQAARALVRVDRDTKTSTGVLIAIIKHSPTRAVRLMAIQCLAEIEGASPKTISVLTDLLRHDPDLSVRLDAAQRLWRMTSGTNIKEPWIIALRSDRNPSIQRVALYALLSTRSMSPDVVTALIAALRIKAVGLDAGVALQRMAPFTDAQLQKILQALADGDPETRHAAAIALTRMRAAASDYSNEPRLELASPRPDSLPAPNPRKDGKVSNYSTTLLGGPAASTIYYEEVFDRILHDDGLSRFPPGRPPVNNEETTRVISLSLRLLKDPRPAARVVGAHMLGTVSKSSDEAVLALIRALKDENDTVRQTAVSALGSYGPDARAAVPDLVRILDDDNAANVRMEATRALCSIGVNSHGAVPALIDALAQDRNEGVRSQAVLALHCLDPAGKEAVAPIIAAVRDDSPAVRSSAFKTLGTYGAKAAEALPLLTEQLRKEELNEEELLRQGKPSSANYGSPMFEIEQAIYRIALSSQEANRVDALDDIEAAEAMVERSPPAVKDQFAYGIKVSVRYLEALKRNSSQGRLFAEIRAHPWITRSLLVLGIYAGLLVLLLPVYWFRPFWIYAIDHRLDPVLSEFRFKPFSLEVPLHYVFLVGFFRHRDRVLDSWVAFYGERIASAFKKTETVHERQPHLDAPVEIDGHSVPALTPVTLRDRLGEGPVRILICGMGGVGKTSLACQIAGWGMLQEPTSRLHRSFRMLPVLIEEDCRSKQLTTVVRDKLQQIIRSESGILSEAFVRRLLERQRILLLVDGLSELGAATRSIIQPGRADFPANFLVVTSRNEGESLGGNRTVIRPSLLRKDGLSNFIGSYLAASRAKDRFNDAEFHLVCAELAEMVGDGEVTAFLAKLYADHLIATKNEGQPAEKPQSVIELVLEYIKKTNAKLTEDPTNVLKAAKILAWECLREHFFPSPASEERAITEISDGLTIPRDAAIKLFRYLEKRLRLIQSVGSTGERFKFALDPVGEYLAALHVAETCGNANDKWDDLLSSINHAQAEPGTKGFLVALLDCCRARGAEFNIPSFVVAALNSFVPAQHRRTDFEIHQRERGSAEQTAITLEMDAAEQSLAPSTSTEKEPVGPERLSSQGLGLEGGSVSVVSTWLLVSLALMVVDWLTKWLVARLIPFRSTIPVIPRLFQLTRFENRGLIFGFFAHRGFQWLTPALIVFAAVWLVIAVRALAKRPPKPYRLGIALFVGGAAANMLERIATGKVVNFLDFYIGSHHWPTFSIADVAVVVGSFLIAKHLIFRQSKPPELLARAAAR